ncbi:hypothetical protein HK097_001811, partial [Rhizophlyctis rosea]
MREVGAGDGAGTDVEGDVEIREAGENGVNVAEGGDDGGKKNVATIFGDDLPMSADFTEPKWEVDYTPDTWDEIYWDLTKLSDPLRNLTEPLKLTKPPSKTELKKFITENYNQQRQHKFLDLLEQKLLGTGRRDGLDDMIQKMASLGLADLEKERDLESLQIENARLRRLLRKSEAAQKSVNVPPKEPSIVPTPTVEQLTLIDEQPPTVEPTTTPVDPTPPKSPSPEPSDSEPTTTPVEPTPPKSPSPEPSDSEPSDLEPTTPLTDAQSDPPQSEPPTRKRKSPKGKRKDSPSKQRKTAKGSSRSATNDGREGRA